MALSSSSGNPNSQPAKGMDEILEDLDPEQRSAVTAIRGPVCVIAGAGTGKTRVITNRIAYAIAAGVTDSSKTLALTFTARAAGEMRARLRNLGVPNATARTFHSAALKQLMYFWPYSFGGSFPSLLTMKSGAIAEAISRTDAGLAPQTSTLREVASEIEWAKVLEIAPEDYVEKALGAGREIRIPNNKPLKQNLEDISKVYQSYETLKQQERAIDFEDVLLLTVGMLEEDREVRERIRDQYRYFTVDEYQDVSPLQQRLLNLWLGNRDDICVVGDAAQTIYSFAGATSSFLMQFTKKYPKAQVIRLSRGYRSTPEIIASANAILRQGGMIGEHGHELASMNVSGAKPEVVGFDSNVAEAKEIVKKIAAIRAEHGERVEVAILTRTNNQLDAFERELAANKIASQLKSSEKFFERVDVRDAMRVIRSASVLPPENGDWYSDLHSVLRPFGETDYVHAFLRLAKEMQADGAKNMRIFLRELEDRAEQNNPPTLPGVVLSTLHAAKGLEWDHVFLAGVSDGILPLTNSQSASQTNIQSNSQSNLDEERRLFYVGLTRARKQVHLSYSGTPSPFLTAIGQ
jgi:DNA helicase-2/ATP-dependent DNA helicase PcrA